MFSELPRARRGPGEAGRRGRGGRTGRSEGSVSVSILIVDDEPDVAELFRQRFRKRSASAPTYCISPAPGEEALEKLAQGIEPQLIVILSDINMPGMDGLTLLREIKTRRPELPVMMVTAYGDEERRRAAGRTARPNSSQAC